MVRAPCCEKIGLKKGSWTPHEDQILVSYIKKNGHKNWRALPQEAGLRRCGKSCRLRWLNYLRPGIKRGNFSEEEEESIFKLHEMLGNRWSTIAKNLPGRTDNEIKNAWHAYLKKRTKYSETLVPNYDSSEFSSFTDLGTSDINNNEIKDEINSCITVPQIDESYQSNKLAENMDIQTDLLSLEDLHVQTSEYNIKKEDDGIDFWYKVLIRTGGLPKVSEL